MRMTMRDLVYGALLTALAILIPIAFTGLRVILGPFTATLASHLPSMLAMIISPWTAALVGIGSAIGFLNSATPIVAMRALTHAIFGAIGAKLYQNGMKFWLVLLITLPIHAISESIVVMFFGFSLYQGLVIVGIGTALHHVMDSSITLALYGSLRKAGVPLGVRSKSPVRHF